MATTTTDLHEVLSRELDTQDLSLEHDTVIVTPEFARRIMEALRTTRESASASDSGVPVTS
jgi:hypothetical protein